MKIVKQIYSKDWDSPVVVVVERGKSYTIHALVGANAYLAEGFFNDWKECVRKAEEIAKRY